MADDELRLRRDTDRAAKAAALSKDPLLVELLNGIDAEIVTAWRSSLPKDAEGRERLYALSWAVAKLRNGMEQAISDGKIAQHILNQPKGKAA